MYHCCCCVIVVVASSLFLSPPSIITAAAYGDLETVRTLLDEGTRVDTRDSNDRTILYHAASFGHADLAQFLLHRGADPNLAESNYGDTPLHIASYEGHANVVRVLLDHGTDPNIQFLHLSCENKRLTLERGVNVNITDNYGNTPLHLLS